MFWLKPIESDDLKSLLYFKIIIVMIRMFIVFLQVFPDHLIRYMA
jgi:hypothetical protein